MVGTAMVLTTLTDRTRGTDGPQSTSFAFDRTADEL
jgi:hypothetical protein